MLILHRCYNHFALFPLTVTCPGNDCGPPPGAKGSLVGSLKGPLEPLKCLLVWGSKAPASYVPQPCDWVPQGAHMGVRIARIGVVPGNAIEHTSKLILLLLHRTRVGRCREPFWANKNAQTLRTAMFPVFVNFCSTSRARTLSATF